MIELSSKFKKSIGNGITTSLYPVLRIYKGVRIDQENQDFEGAAEETINLSIKEVNIKDSQGVSENYLPLLKAIPSLSQSADIINNKFRTSSINISIYNSIYNGKKFSDNVIDILKSVCQVYYVANGVDDINDCLLIYTGTIRRFRQEKESITLELEDYTQQTLSALVPTTRVPEDPTQYTEKDYNKPYPAVYGHIDASPMIFNKLDRLEIDKPNQELYGYWNGGTQIDFINQSIDSTFEDNNYLFQNAYLSVYDRGHLFIFEQPVEGWGARNHYEMTGENKFYEFTNSTLDVSAHISLNRNTYVYTQYEKEGADYVGSGELGIPARAYRPIEKVSFYSKNFMDEEDSEYNRSENYFIGYANGVNDDIADLVSSYKSRSGQLNGIASGSSTMKTRYDEDWNPNNTPSYNFWQPTELNDITTQVDGFEVWSTRDSNFSLHNKTPEFPVEWIQNGLKTTGLHMYARNHRTSLEGGCFAKLDLGGDIGSFPCITKIFYDLSYFTPRNYGDQGSSINIIATPSIFWSEGDLITRSETPFGVLDTASLLIESENRLWEKDRDNNDDLFFTTPANAPNSQHEFNSPVFVSGETERIDTPESIINNTGYNNILRGFNNSSSNQSIYWGMPIYDGGHVRDTFATIANLRNIYVFQDIVIDKLYERDYFVNVAGRTKDGNLIERIEDIAVDILENELDFEQNIDLNPINEGWKFDFVLSEQKEVKQIFEDLFKSSLCIPSYNNFGQFKLLPLHQNLDGVNYVFIDTDDTINHSFNLTKLDDVKNSVNVKYYKNYATGNLERETGYRLIDNYTDYTESNTFENFDELSKTNFPESQFPENFRYDIDYYGLQNTETKLEVESEYIRDELTAYKLQRRLVTYHANQHLMVNLELPVSYINLEVGDYIRFDKLINNDKVFGYDYTESEVRNGQYIYPIFFIKKIIKSVDKVKIEAIQVHRGLYDIPSDVNIGNFDSPLIQESGSEGNLNLEFPDPFDNPQYSDENINVEEEIEQSIFNVNMSENLVLNNGQVTAIVNSNISDWNFNIYFTEVMSNDGNGIIIEDDIGGSVTIPDGNYDINNQPTLVGGLTASNLLTVIKSQTDMADIFNGQVSINNLYAIDGVGSYIKFGITIQPINFATDNPAGFIFNYNFEQLGTDLNYAIGDVNADGIINVLDVVRMVNIVLSGEGTNTNTDEKDRADMNGDNIVNVLDVVTLVNLILG
tara:strand:- start:502 stop:4128 length:3627 start_codon:yes stop_codon:yes gene_type:complete